MFKREWAFTGNELKKMFLEHGTFEAMEMMIERKRTTENSEKLSGGWYTKLKLEQQESYNQKLPSTSCLWHVAFLEVLWNFAYQGP